MKKRIRITSIRRDPPDTTLLAQVLIELVLQRREKEAKERAATQQRKEAANG